MSAICITLLAAVLPAHAQQVSAAAQQQAQCDGEVCVIVMLHDRATNGIATANGRLSKRNLAPKLHPRVRNVVSTAATWDFSGPAITFLGCTETATAPLQPTCFSNRIVTTDRFAAGAFVRAPGFNGATSNFGGTSQAAPTSSVA